MKFVRPNEAVDWIAALMIKCTKPPVLLIRQERIGGRAQKPPQGGFCIFGP